MTLFVLISTVTGDDLRAAQSLPKLTSSDPASHAREPRVPALSWRKTEETYTAFPL